MNESGVSVPLPVRLRFGHAAVQHLADEIGVDLLHIKGAAVDPSLRPGGYAGSDVDVLVRPTHVAMLDRAMRQRGWRLYSTFEYGSPFGHAQTYLHDAWGYIDIHRFFPGIRLEPDRAFDVFWTDRHEIEIAGIGCQVPSVPAQGVLLVLNAARSAMRTKPDVRGRSGTKPPRSAARRCSRSSRSSAHTSPSPQLPAALNSTAASGITGCGRSFPRAGPARPSGGHDVRAAPTLGAAIRVAARAPFVNVDHLAHRLGRPPTRG